MRWWLVPLLVVAGELVASFPQKPAGGWIKRTRRGNLHLSKELGPVIRSAIKEGKIEILQSLSAQGVDFNLPLSLPSGDLPLVLAVAESQPSIVKWLVAEGVELNNSEMFHTPLHATLTGTAWSSAHSDRRHADLEMLMLVLELGADPEAINVRRDRPLHIAARLGDLSAVVILCENGAELDSRGCDGYTPLMHAAEGGWSAVVDYLLARGAEINATNNRQESAAMLAVRAGHLKLKELFAAHPDFDEQLTDRRGKTQRQWLTEMVEP